MPDDLRERAQQVFAQAYEAQMQGELRRALVLYSEAIALHPTAEAYTFRGWTYSFQGDYARAISDCLRAIDLDPGFGNPYNDIGAYLIEQGKLEEAIPWLEKATQAPRYDCRCFPYFNLGRVYERRRQIGRAQQHYELALLDNAQYVPALRALKRVRASWN